MYLNMHTLQAWYVYVHMYVCIDACLLDYSTINNCTRENFRLCSNELHY